MYVSAVAALLLALGVTLSYVSGTPSFNVWNRPSPLVGAVPVVSVHDGVMVLADGRAFTPDGVRRANGLAPEQFDLVLRVAGAQGVVVERDLGDGRAMVTVEPRFYNGCGSHSGWTRWAGSYVRHTLSQFLVLMGYAAFDPSQAGLTPMERWRLEGAAHIAGRPADLPWAPGAAFHFSGAMGELSPNLDEYITCLWQPPR